MNEIQSTTVGSSRLELADALDRYGLWPAPTVIVSDGPYGLGLFPGDPHTTENLADIYEPHVAAWARYSLPETTLWFWNSEIGWATVHPVLARHGWQYRECNVWDKGIGHVAGNCNSRTIRKFPVVSEVCVQYVRDVHLVTGDGLTLPMRAWLRHEWLRSGLPLRKTNEACGVKDAATRKYFTQDWLWYFPPPEMMQRLSAYANHHGSPTATPYFSLDGGSQVTAEKWSRMRAKWNHVHGITNVWSHLPVRGDERLKDRDSKTLHANQKPLRLVERTILASSDPGDVVWEPFGGMSTGAIASIRTGRACHTAEINPTYYLAAKNRLERG